MYQARKMALSTCRHSEYAFTIKSKCLYKVALFVSNLKNVKTEAHRTWLTDPVSKLANGRGRSRTFVQMAPWSILIRCDAVSTEPLSALEGSIFWDPSWHKCSCSLPYCQVLAEFRVLGVFPPMLMYWVSACENLDCCFTLYFLRHFA